MRCNLYCIGCYVVKYDKLNGFIYEEVDRIIGEVRDFEVYYIIVFGGELFFVDFMYDIYKKYDDIFFIFFINGMFFNNDIVDKLVFLGNVMLMFFFEGFEKEIDVRCGSGIFNKVMEGMDLLKLWGILFGVFFVILINNFKIVIFDEFIDMFVKKGFRMNWYFMYMFVGEFFNIDNMLKLVEWIEFGRLIKKIRLIKLYFIIDFFNDVLYVGGCIVGKYYCYINLNGDVEFCIFVYIVCDNIKDKNLIDIFKSEFFKDFRYR